MNTVAQIIPSSECFFSKTDVIKFTEGVGFFTLGFFSCILLAALISRYDK